MEGKIDLEENKRFRLGEWLIDPESGEISRGETRRHLEPKVMEVLASLARHPGRVISREQLLEWVWSETFVTDDALWRCMVALRKALEDNPRSPRYIETLPRRGYRLVAPVERGPGRPPSNGPDAVTLAPDPVTARSGGHQPQRWVWLGVSALAVVLVIVALASVAGRRDGPTSRPQLAQQREDGTSSSPVLTSRDYYQLAYDRYQRLEEDDLERALELFSRAIAVDPDFASAHAGLANVYGQMALRSPDAPRWVDDAVATAQRALAFEPDLPEAYKALGLAYQAGGELQAARSAYRRALDLAPGMDPAANNLASILRGSGELAEALAWQRSIIPKLPEQRLIQLVNLGRTYYLLGDLERARASANALVEVEPKSPAGWLALIRIDLVEGRVDRASKRSRQCIDAIPDAVRCATLAGLAEELSGRSAQARPLLEWAVAEGDPSAVLYLAHLLWSSGDRSGAEELLEHFPDPGDTGWSTPTEGWRASFRSSAIHAIRGRTEPALAWLELAIRQGFRDARWLAVDPIFAHLRDKPGFKRLAAELDRAVEIEHRQAEAAPEPPSLLPLSVRLPSSGSIRSSGDSARVR